MNIILAISSFKNYLSSIEANIYLKKLLKKGLKSKYKIKIYPMADGGENTLEVLKYYFGGKTLTISTYDIYHKKILIKGLNFEKKSVFIGSSDILGLRNYNTDRINPETLSSYGLGIAIKKLSKKYKNIYIGLGGTMVADAGIGALEGCGAKFFDSELKEIKKISHDKIKKINKFYIPKLFTNNKIYFLMDADTIFRDLRFVISNKIGANFKNKKKNITSKIIKNIKFYSSKIHKKKIVDVMYSANAGGIWLSFFNLKNTYAVNGAKFISVKSKIKKNNLKKNVMIVGEGAFDNSLLGKGPVFLLSYMNNIKKNYYLTGKIDVPNIKFRKKNFFFISKPLFKKYNIKDVFLLPSYKLSKKNVKKQLQFFSKIFLKIIR